MPQLEALAAQLDRLASLEPSTFPVLSLYLSLLPDEHGREHFEPFLRKELPERIRTFSLRSPERDSLERDAEKVHAFLKARHLLVAANDDDGVAGVRRRLGCVQQQPWANQYRRHHRSRTDRHA